MKLRLFFRLGCIHINLFREEQAGTQVVLFAVTKQLSFWKRFVCGGSRNHPKQASSSFSRGIKAQRLLSAKGISQQSMVGREFPE